MSDAWHPLKLICPTCSKPTAVLTVAISADGGLYQEGICFVCGHDVQGVINVFHAVLSLPSEGRVQ